MAEIANPHDRFFREVFSRLDLSREFLSKQLPAAIAASLDFMTLDLRPGSFLDEELQQYFSDLLFRVNLQTGHPAYVYILLEHKSYVEWFTGLQLLRYKVEIWEQVRKEQKAKAEQRGKSNKKQKRAKLPPIFPLVIYQQKRKWNAPQYFHDLIDASAEWLPYQPNFKYELVSVVSLRETELFSAVLLRAAIRLMRHIFDPDLAHKLSQIWEEFRSLAWGPDEQGFLIVMLSYITSANANVTTADLKHSLEMVLADRGGNLVKTLAEQWLEQGAHRALLDSIRTGLAIRFNAESSQLMHELEQTQDLPKLRQILSALFKTTTLVDFQEACRLVLAGNNVSTNAHLN